MARDQPTRLSVVPSRHPAADPAEREPGPGLTPAEEHAMRRSAPLTPEQFKELRRVAEQGIRPLRHA